MKLFKYFRGALGFKRRDEYEQRCVGLPPIKNRIPMPEFFLKLEGKNMSYLKINDEDVDINGKPYEHSHPLDDFLKNISISKIEFQLQNGPIKEAGLNGLDISDLIYIASRIIVKFNKECPCAENQKTFNLLQEAIEWQLKREKDRIEREVEGTSDA